MQSQPLFGLEGRIACVTGASSGLGRAAATMLARAGAKVVGVARRQEALDAWRSETEGETAALAADLGDRQALERIVGDTAGIFGSPDILVNAAGVNTRQAADDVTAEGWDSTIHLNLTVPFFLAQKFAASMKARGWGRILNFASLQSRRAFPGGIAYGASKGGVEQMTRAMAEAWSRHGINANAVAPGFFPTELTGPVFSDPELSERNARQTCIGRNGRMEDLEGPLLFLCSRASDYVTGQVLFVDGGFTAK
jgi:NAD(P)-dependent dehydrogenase (short-subunit alcohol dehydrogenase family)